MPDGVDELHHVGERERAHVGAQHQVAIPGHGSAIAVEPLEQDRARRRPRARAPSSAGPRTRDASRAPPARRPALANGRRILLAPPAGLLAFARARDRRGVPVRLSVTQRACDSRPAWLRSSCARIAADGSGGEAHRVRASDSQRRRYERVRADIPVRISTIEPDLDPLTGRTYFRASQERCANLSRGGVFVRDARAARPGPPRARRAVAAGRRRRSRRSAASRGRSARCAAPSATELDCGRRHRVPRRRRRAARARSRSS